MRFPRMTTRRWMMVVVVAALLASSALEALRLHRLSQSYRRKAGTARYWERRHLWEADMASKAAQNAEVELRQSAGSAVSNEEMKVVVDQVVGEWSTKRDQHTSAASHFERLERKYERAARYPGLSIEPDPPEPK